MYKAVFFDIGGVCVHSPLQGIRKFEKSAGLPENFLNVAIQARGENGAFQKLERGELPLSEFYTLFGNECSDFAVNVPAYNAWLKSKGKRTMEIPPKRIDGKELFTAMMVEAMKPNDLVLNAVRKLKASGKIRVAALTNNFQFEDTSAFGKPPAQVVELFGDHYIESSLVGLRKPDPKFFIHACDRLGVLPQNAIMVDDIGPNLKAAKELGMATVRKSREALQQLEKLVEIPLLDSIEPPHPPVKSSTLLFLVPPGASSTRCTVYPSAVSAPTHAQDSVNTIETPDVQLVPNHQMTARIKELFSSEGPVQPQELADEAYILRHRSHEYAEKRLRNREREYVRHQLYLRRTATDSMWAATHPRTTQQVEVQTVGNTFHRPMRLKGAYILPESESEPEESEQPVLDLVPARKRTRTPRISGVGAGGSCEALTAFPVVSKRLARGPMAFGAAVAVVPAQAFERAEPLLAVLREFGKI
ncbi:hypothetical protein HDU86_007010 [Geranomyces michiganensis]|nr:hypothetical protein HDU86_007010 [Geranomyces michiganensis]